LFDCLDLVPNRGACIVACLSGHVTRSFLLHDIGLVNGISAANQINFVQRKLLGVLYNVYAKTNLYTIGI